jgi:hypothetical protein
VFNLDSFSKLLGLKLVLNCQAFREIHTLAPDFVWALMILLVSIVDSTSGSGSGLREGALLCRLRYIKQC